MSGISGISGIGSTYGGYSPSQIASPTDVGSGQAIEPGNVGEASGGGSILSLSSTSMSATSETLLAANSPMLASNEAIGAALLLLVLQYLQTSDSGEKQNLTDMIGALAGMQQQGQGGGGLLMYSSSSISMESTQLTIATGQGLNAYTGASASLQQAPQADASAGGLNVVV